MTRIIARACLALLLTAAPILDARSQNAVTMNATTMNATVAEVGAWAIWGTRVTFVQDGAVPGGTAVTTAAREDRTGDPWASAASIAVPLPLKAGDRVSATFWARATRPETVPIMINGAAPSYAVLASRTVGLTPDWRRITLSGVAPADLAAGTQFLTLHLGRAPADTQLGPVLFRPGVPDDADIQAAFAGFRPAQRVQDVPIPSDPGIVLAGRLRLPGRHGDGPFPVVVLLSGSGPGKRGVFPLIEDRLLAEGIATLDYDKRGVGESTGTFVDTLGLMERDAAAAVAYLRTRPDIDGGRVAFLGLSQGAYVGPAVAARDPAIAAVVMLAGPAGERGTLFTDDMREKLGKAGIAGDANDRVVAALEALYGAHIAGATPSVVGGARQELIDAFVAGGWSPAQADAVVAELDTPAVLSLYQAAPNEALARIRAPVLALYAERDTVVPTHRAMPEAQRALHANPDATVLEIPGVNHGFQHIDTHTPGPLEPAVSAPEVLDLVQRWLGDRLRAGPKMN
ncbi:alpha/beta hydrolase family protein [Nitrospirillum pindoramense]|uniref:X-Pro dipeptidyl-peptidase-like protein n=1 Tax=Nitrospirillum amazonense TaxID=28077 RepID=A0A560HKT4_9PROT|nr:alpha/beta hydrolase [Nitrospirillum amazonense]TWB45780.1 X-Pro dipeptidyl-peptidase-like protein [Nitrospirillum amazonense]